MNWLITEESKLFKVADAETAAQTDVTTDAVDTAGFKKTVFFSSFGTAASDNLPHAEQATASDGSFTDLEDTEVNVSTSDEDVYLEIAQPEERYIRTVWERGTSSTLGDIWCLQMGARDLPIDNTTAGTQHGEAHVRPDEGTI